jgi:hypothetical protein
MLPLPHVQPAELRRLLRAAWRRVDSWTLQAFNGR